jgi:hypothetical protein
MPDLKVVTQEGVRFDPPDAAWMAAILLFAAIVYGATTYTETWDSAKDITTPSSPVPWESHDRLGHPADLPVRAPAQSEGQLDHRKRGRRCASD